MIITTTQNIEGKEIVEYKGLVFGEVISGANILRDFLASITDIIGGRSKTYEKNINEARNHALKELKDNAQRLGANAVVGVSFEYQMGGTKDMFIVVATGTAVVLR